MYHHLHREGSKGGLLSAALKHETSYDFKRAMKQPGTDFGLETRRIWVLSERRPSRENSATSCYRRLLVSLPAICISRIAARMEVVNLSANLLLWRF